MKISGNGKVSVPGKPPISKSDEKCIDTLTAYQDDEYMLVDSGFIPEEIPVGEIAKATDFLFNELVAIEQVEAKNSSEKSKTLLVRSESLLATTGISARDDFKKSYPIECEVFGVHRHLHCNYGLGNGHPEALMQRVVLTREWSVNNCTLLFGSLKLNAKLTPASSEDGPFVLPKCSALIQSSDIISYLAEEAVKQLEALCTVIDVEASDAAKKLQSLAAHGKTQPL